MYRSLSRVFITLGIVGGVCVPLGGRPIGSVPAVAATSPNVLYVSGGHLMLQAIDGGAPRTVPSPWSLKTGKVYPSVSWSPDGQRVAMDDGVSRLAVVNLATNHITYLGKSSCTKNCSPPLYTWSPNGRYLAIIKPNRNSAVATLSVWDSQQGTTRRLLGNLAGYSTGADWSHDSTRVATETGKFDTMKNIYPDLAVVSVTGGVLRLAKGDMTSWSPDDRFLGVIAPHFCGANTCDEAELVYPSGGGAGITLMKHVSSSFDNPIWAPQPRGYAFDRWLLNGSGHITRHLAGPRERIDDWSPDGAHVAVQTYYPYQGTPDVLYLAKPGGGRVHVYTDTRGSGCGACSKDTYRVSWSRGDSIFAFITRIYPDPQNRTVYPKLFVSPIGGGARTEIAVPRSENQGILGFVNGDQEIVLYSGKILYRYSVATHQLSVIATRVANVAGTPALDPTVLK